MALGEFLAVLAHDHGQVAVLRGLPAEGFIQQNVQRTGGNPLLRPHDVRDGHQMIVHHVGQMIGRETVRFQQYRIGGNILVFLLHLSEQDVLKHGGTFQRHFEADNRLDTLPAVLIPLLFGEVAAVPVVTLPFLLLFLLLPQCVQALGAAVAVVGVAALDQLFGVFFIEIEALGLHVGSVAAVFIGALVPADAEPFEGVVQILQRFIVITLAIGIFYP